MDPTEQLLRRRLARLSEALAPLHRLLIDEVRQDYERHLGPVGSPVALVRLLVSHPFFAWLRPMSMLMADIDELVDRDEAVAPGDLGAVRLRLESLISGGEGETAFATHYLAVLQRNVDVVLAHAAVRRALDGL